MTEELLQEAKKKFPIGTKYKPRTSEGIYTIKSEIYLTGWARGNNIYAKDSDGLLWRDGIWAEIIESPYELY